MWMLLLLLLLAVGRVTDVLCCFADDAAPKEESDKEQGVYNTRCCDACSRAVKHLSASSRSDEMCEYVNDIWTDVFVCASDRPMIEDVDAKTRLKKFMLYNVNRSSASGEKCMSGVSWKYLDGEVRSEVSCYSPMRQLDTWHIADYISLFFFLAKS